MARPIVMPELGMYTAEGTLTDWLRSPGDNVEAGEPVVEITTEKATYQIDAPEAGVLHAIAQIGTNLPVQALIGYILVYASIFSAGLYYLMRVLYVGLEGDGGHTEDEADRPARPLSAAHVQFEYDSEENSANPAKVANEGGQQ